MLDRLQTHHDNVITFENKILKYPNHSNPFLKPLKLALNINNKIIFLK